MASVGQSKLTHLSKNHCMTSSNGNIFRVTGHLSEEFTGQWGGALLFFMICTWIKCWVNNREAGDLKRHRANYDVTVMMYGVSFNEG